MTLRAHSPRQPCKTPPSSVATPWTYPVCVRAVSGPRIHKLPYKNNQRDYCTDDPFGTNNRLRTYIYRALCTLCAIRVHGNDDT